MSLFLDLSEFLRGFYALWALLLCLLSLADIILSLTKRKYLLAGLSLVVFVMVYIFFQVVFDYSLREKRGGYSPLSEAMVSWPWVSWLLSFTSLTLLSFVLFARNIVYQRRDVSVNSIKTYLDQVDFGICWYKDSGRVVFSNIAMNELCLALTGSPLLHGGNLREAIKEEMMDIGEKKWRFHIRDITLKGEKMSEIIATDVTSEYQKTLILEEGKRELTRVKKELQDYYLSIDATVAHQEILQAKMNIHDEMNRLMLSSLALDHDSEEELERILRLWEENASLLSKEAEREKAGTLLRHIEELAQGLKIELTWDKSSFEALNIEQRRVLLLAAQEALTNAAKHGHATAMKVEVLKEENGLECRFKNNGDPSPKEVLFTGGLANLEEVCHQSGARLCASGGEEFVLSLHFPPRNNSNGGCAPA